MLQIQRQFVYLLCFVGASFVVLSHLFAVPAEGRTFRDQLGREVQVPDNPRRLIALAPSVTELIIALGEEDRLVGVTQHCDIPNPTRTLARVGSFIHPDVERIVALQPDLCIAIKEGNPRDLVSKLEFFKIPVYVIDPSNLNGVMATVLEFGQLMGASSKAELFVQNMKERIGRVKSRVQQAKYHPKVFFQISAAPIVSAGTHTFVHELITMSGGNNLAQGPTRYPRLGLEQVLKLQPDVIIITSMLKDQETKQAKDEWNKWPSIPAVRDGRTYIVDADLFDRPGPRLVEALELLSQLIHPELF